MEAQELMRNLYSVNENWALEVNGKTLQESQITQVAYDALY